MGWLFPSYPNVQPHQASSGVIDRTHHLHPLLNPHRGSPAIKRRLYLPYFLLQPRQSLSGVTEGSAHLPPLLCSLQGHSRLTGQIFKWLLVGGFCLPIGCTSHCPSKKKPGSLTFLGADLQGWVASQECMKWRQHTSTALRVQTLTCAVGELDLNYLNASCGQPLQSWMWKSDGQNSWWWHLSYPANNVLIVLLHPNPQLCVAYDPAFLHHSS